MSANLPAMHPPVRPNYEVLNCEILHGEPNEYWELDHNFYAETEAHAWDMAQYFAEDDHMTPTIAWVVRSLESGMVVFVNDLARKYGARTWREAEVA